MGIILDFGLKCSKIVDGVIFVFEDI